VALYKGFVNSEKLGIQICQNPAIFKNSRICLEVGVGIEHTVFFSFCVKVLLALGGFDRSEPFLR
jgi:hypothetical protein